MMAKAGGGAGVLKGLGALTAAGQLTQYRLLAHNTVSIKLLPFE